MPQLFIIIFKILILLIIILLAVSYIAEFFSNKRVEKEVEEFFQTNVKNRESENGIRFIEINDLAGLPRPVKKWLEHSQVIGKERINSVRSKQTAVMRMKEGQKWMPLESKQYFTVDEPGFIWQAKVKAAPLIHIMGRDKYYEGKGNMLIKIMSLFTVADGKGKEMDQGSLVRYLAEIVWLPTAALSEYIKWEEVDENSARATMSYRGVTASGVFSFNDKGEVTSFEAQRYGDFDGKYSLETWFIAMSNYKELSGVRIPTGGRVIWKLRTGDFHWYSFKVEEIEYNRPEIY